MPVDIRTNSDLTYKGKGTIRQKWLVALEKKNHGFFSESGVDRCLHLTGRQRSLLIFWRKPSVTARHQTDAASGLAQCSKIKLKLLFYHNFKSIPVKL